MEKKCGVQRKSSLKKEMSRKGSKKTGLSTHRGKAKNPWAFLKNKEKKGCTGTKDVVHLKNAREAVRGGMKDNRMT